MAYHNALHALHAVNNHFNEVGSVGNIQISLDAVCTSLNRRVQNHNRLAKKAHHVDGSSTRSARAEVNANRADGRVGRHSEFRAASSTEVNEGEEPLH